MSKYGESASVPSLLRCPEVGEYLMARYSEDGCWYRCRVVAVRTKTKVEVAYVDYGNEELVEVSELKPLPKSLTNQPAIAIECALARAKPVSKEVWRTQGLKLFRQLFGKQT